MSASPPVHYKQLPQKIPPREVRFEKATYQINAHYSPTEITITSILARAIQKATLSAAKASSTLRLDPGRAFQLQLSVDKKQEESACFGCSSKIVTYYKVVVMQGDELSPYPIPKKLSEVAHTFFKQLNCTDFTLINFFFSHLTRNP